MPTGSALVCKLKNLEPIEKADNLLKADMYGETIIVSKDHKEGELGLLFDCETQLSDEFCHANNLYRHSELNKDKDVKGYFDDNRRVRAIRLRGVKCSGFWIPINSLDNIENINLSKDSIKEGIQITSFQGVDICKKYEVPTNTHISQTKSKKKKKTLADKVKGFYEHFSTNYFMRQRDPVKDGDQVIITEKLHGTSCRCGRLKVDLDIGLFKRIVQNVFYDEPLDPYRFVVGSRRVVKSIDGKAREGVNHYYDTDLWSRASHDHFEGKLNDGETIFFEIVGYNPETGKNIMPTKSNSVLKEYMDKDEYEEFIERYGERTEFSYGCVRPGQIAENHRKGIPHSNVPFYKVFVYRITRTLCDGRVIDLSWKQLKKRCAQMDVNHVPELMNDTAAETSEGIYLHKDLNEGGHYSLEAMIEYLTYKESRSFPQHLREGVCVRVENGDFTPTILKSKSTYFRMLES